MKISVAMTIFNGEKYLEEQLLSIFEQSVQVDELIACDDGSTDNSKRIFCDFVEKHALSKKWKYIKNERNKGYIDNFLDCASLCSGDVVFFSDQDDIWDKNKIQSMISVFNDHSEAMVVCCSVSCIDENNDNCDTWLNRLRIGNGSTRRIPFEEQVSSMISSGLTMAFRRAVLFDIAYTIRKYNLQYDSPFGLVYSIKGQFYRIEKPLVLHRVHSSNASNPSYSLSGRKFDRHIRGREIQYKSLCMVEQEYADDLSTAQKRGLSREICYRRKAIEAMRQRKIGPLFLQLFRFGKMDNKLIDVSNFVLTIKDRFFGVNYE